MNTVATNKNINPAIALCAAFVSLMIQSSPSLSASIEEIPVKLAVKSVPQHLVLGNLTTMVESNVTELLAEGLFEVGQGFKIKPVLADSIRWSNTGKEFTVRLRAAHFSDGTPLTTKEVINSLTRCIRNSEVNISVPLRSVQGYQDLIQNKISRLPGLKKISDVEFSILLDRPSPLLPEALATNNCYIVKDNNSDLLHGAIGSGAYTVGELTPTTLKLIKNNHFHLDSNYPKTVFFEQTDAWGDFSKLKDWSNVIISEESFEKNDGFNSYDFADLAYYQLILNNSKKPFNNVAVRKAINEGINFDVLSEGYHWEHSFLQKGLFPLGMRSFRARADKRNLPLALKLLNSAGYNAQHPLTFTIYVTTSNIAEMEKGIWPKVFDPLPIKPVVAVLPQNEVIRKMNKNAFEAIRLKKLAVTLDGERLLTSFLSNSNQNTTKSVTPDCDELIKNALTISSIEKRQLEYEKADLCLIDQHQIFIPLASTPYGQVYIKKPWKIMGTNRYDLKPFRTYLWKYDGAGKSTNGN